MTICPKCNTRVQSDEPDREYEYCGLVCEEAGKLEERRLARRLQRIEDEAMNLRLGLRWQTMDDEERETYVPKFQAEIDVMERRLRVLLEASVLG